MDSLTSWLNDKLLQDNGWGAYHAGVEVYGEEWAFIFYTDVVDPKTSGVYSVHPRQNPDVGEYKTSVYMGRTPLSFSQARTVIAKLHGDWPTLTYHLTNNNCIAFAEHLCAEMKVPRRFPTWVRGFLDMAEK